MTSYADRPEFMARGLALARAAEALLMAGGGAEIALRMNTATLDATAQFGAGLQQALDVPVFPAAVRVVTPATDATPARYEVLIPAATLDRIAKDQGLGSGTALLASCMGVVHQGSLLVLERVAADSFGGAPYLVRVTVTE